MADKTPYLVGAHRGFNLVALGDDYCAAHQALGPLDLSSDSHRRDPRLLWDKDDVVLRRRIDAERLWRPFDPLYSDVPLDQFGPPEVIEIEPIHTCNLRCVMCHVTYEDLSKKRLDVQFLDHMDGLEGKWAKLGSLYEPTAHPQFAEIAQGLTDRGLDIDLATNGTLFTPSLIKRTGKCNFSNVTVSFDGIRPGTYERIRQRANFAKTTERIRAFKDAVKARNPHCRFQINYTILQSNIEEISEAVDFWEAEGFDHIGFIAMVRRRDNATFDREAVDGDLGRLAARLDEAALRVINHDHRITLSSTHFRSSRLKQEFPRNVGLLGEGIVTSNHPEVRLPATPSEYFQNGSYPGMAVNCRSPFKFARITYDGQVNLCFQFSVGKIYDAQLLDLWNGPAADHIRHLVTKDAETCHSCEYFKYCIKAAEIDYTKSNNFVSENRVENVTRTEIYNILKWMGRYYATPIWLPVSASDLADTMSHPGMGILQSDSCDAVLKLTRTRKPPITALPADAPLLLGTFRGYNVVWFKGKLHGVPDELAPIDFLKLQHLGRREVLSANSFESLRAVIYDRLAVGQLAKRTLRAAVSRLKLKCGLRRKSLLEHLFAV